ncbi:MAG: hypothetical protein KDC62_11755 [Aequorivita sp.]|nr:hypothetical protein [Aequorivita sp.]
MKRVDRKLLFSKILEEEFKFNQYQYSIIDFENEFVIELFEISRIDHKLLIRIYDHFETQNVDIEATDYHSQPYSEDQIESFDYEIRVLL